MPSNPRESKALSKLRKGALLFILSFALSLSSNLTWQTPAYVPPPVVIVNGTIEILGRGYDPQISLILSIITTIISMLAAIAFQNSFMVLAKTLGNIGSLLYLIGSTLTLITYITLIILTKLLPTVYNIFYITIILLIVGQILMGISIYRLGLKYNQNITFMGGIIIAISSILYVPLSILGYLLTYIGLRKMARKTYK